MEKITLKRINDNLTPTSGVIISLLLGALIFLLYFEPHILNPAYISWLTEGDRLQHYLGSYAFRVDDWHFPITKTNLIAPPEGVSIVYTDSNPILSVLFKAFRFIFPPEYQFFGLWFLLCWMLQALLPYKIVTKLTNNKIYGFLASIAFCLMPAMFHRIMHTNLIAFWIILWAIHVYLIDDKYEVKKIALFICVVLIGLLIHGYLGIMASLIFATWFIKKGIEYIKIRPVKKLLIFIARLIIGLIFSVFVLWIFGFFYNSPQGVQNFGFGDYSMNVLAPFNPTSKAFSIILPSLENMKSQRVEGFQYLGLGIILLYGILFTLLLAKKIIKVKSVVFIVLLLFGIFISVYFKEIAWLYRALLFVSITFGVAISISFFKQSNNPIKWLIIPALLSIIIALSNKVYLGEHKILRYSIFESGVGQELFNIIRSSGRFFWVANTVFLLYIFYYLFDQFQSSRSKTYIIVLCLVIQFVDLSAMRTYTNNERIVTTPIISKDYETLIKSSKKVDFIECNDKHVSLVAVKNNIPINSFYMVHGNGKITRERLEVETNALKKGGVLLNDSTIYFIKKYQYWRFPPENKLLYYNFNEELLAVTTQNYNFDCSSLKSTKSFPSFYNLEDIVNEIEQSELFVIAVKDEATQKLPISFIDKMDNIYKTHLKNLQFRQAYIAVFKNGVLVHEEVGLNNNLLSYSLIKNNLEVISGGGSNNIASIKIDEQEYSKNQRGLNIVFLKKGKYQYWHFDTYSNNY